MGPGPRARALKGLGPGGRGHSFFEKQFWIRLVLCAGVLSYVQGSKSYVQGSKSYVQGQSLMCRGKV